MNKTLLSAIGGIVGLSGCATFKQDGHQVLVRDPTKGKYEAPADASPHAKRQWVYAAMSDFAYETARVRAFEDKGAKPITMDVTAKLKTCGGNAPPEIPDEWSRWEDFPSPDLSSAMRKKGLFLLVLERNAQPREIVVVFEGTNFTELPDWGANLRWFLRFIPGFEDQYTITAREVSNEFYQRIKSQPEKYQASDFDENLRSADGNPIKIVSTGHSLGGGLAQHFAYTFKQSPKESKGPKVSEVYAFDPSPVTGWYSSEDPPRSHNARGLVINRIFEHGEILAYIRLLTSRLAVSSQNPSIWEYRYNFDSKANIVRNHSIRSLACGLAKAASDSS
jgi:Lipase (class 3)